MQSKLDVINSELGINSELLLSHNILDLQTDDPDFKKKLLDELSKNPESTKSLIEAINNVFNLETKFYIENKTDLIATTIEEKKLLIFILLTVLNETNKWFFKQNQHIARTYYNIIKFLDNTIESYRDIILLGSISNIPFKSKTHGGSNYIHIYDKVVLSFPIEDTQIITINDIELLKITTHITTKGGHKVFTQLLKILIDINSIKIYCIFEKYKSSLHTLLKTNAVFVDTILSTLLSTTILYRIEEQLIEKLEILANLGYRCNDIKLENILCDDDNNIFLHDLDIMYCVYPIKTDEKYRFSPEHYKLIYYLIIYFQAFKKYNVNFNNLKFILFTNIEKCKEIFKIFIESYTSFMNTSDIQLINEIFNKFITLYLFLGEEYTRKSKDQYINDINQVYTQIIEHIQTYESA